MLISILEPFIFLCLILLTIKKDDTDFSKKNQYLSRSVTDIIKGIAILMVILMHTSCDAGQRVFTPFGGIGVALFLIMSGYGLTESFKTNGLLGFWRKKVVRIWIPYIILIISLIVIRQDWNRILSFDFLLDISCLNTSYWYISFLIWNYIIFFVTFKFISPKYWHLPFIIIGICIFLFDTRLRAEQILSFPLGISLSLYKDKLQNILSRHATIASLFIIAISVLLFKQTSFARIHMEEIILVQNSIDLVCKFGFAVYFISIITVLPPPFLQILIRSKFLKLCANMSLELYLVHFTLRFIIDKNNQFQSLILFLIGTFVVSILYNQINKKISSCLR